MVTLTCKALTMFLPSARSDRQSSPSEEMGTTILTVRQRAEAFVETAAAGLLHAGVGIPAARSKDSTPLP